MIGSEFSPNHLTRALEGWQKNIHGGQWRYLIQYGQTNDKFEEIEMELNAGQISKLPSDFFQTIKIIHVTSGGPVQVCVSPFEEQSKFTLHENDCLVVGSEVECQFEAAQDTCFDVTISQKIDDPKFRYFVKYIPVTEQVDHEFLGSTAMQRFKMVVNPELLDGLLSRCVFYVAPGENGPPFHKHPTHETFRMLKDSGPIKVAINGNIQTDLQAGDYFNVYPEQVHSFKNPHAEEAKLVATLYPAGIEKTFLKFSELYKQFSKQELTKEQYTQAMQEARCSSQCIKPVPGYHW